MMSASSLCLRVQQPDCALNALQKRGGKRGVQVAAARIAAEPAATSPDASEASDNNNNNNSHNNKNNNNNNNETGSTETGQETAAPESPTNLNNDNNSNNNNNNKNNNNNNNYNNNNNKNSNNNNNNNNNKSPGCEGIQCRQPSTALGYKGMAWPTMSFPGKKEMHIFAIGDWGGLDGSLVPIEGRKQLVVYNGGRKSGPSVFPRNRWNKQTTVLLCHHFVFLQCYCDPVCPTVTNPKCLPGCGYEKGVDDQAQLLVATAMKARAAKSNPDYILNVGDNFYWGGIEKNCGTPMDELSPTAKHQFDQIFEGIYNGPGLSGKPWLSVLGNHDWGGRVFNNGWDQQIAYTWKSNRWIMPAPYWSQHIEYPDLGFSVDIYMIDSNAMDALDGPESPSHNICSSQFNPANADCSMADGPPSLGACKSWFWSFWAENQAWLESQLPKSKADWQIVVTHFPCGHQKNWYRTLHQKYGLDLLVTGHRHDQELHAASEELGGLTCFVTGGGGGISSEATPNPADKQDWYGEGQYGFYDLTISKTEMLIQSINYDGKVWKEATVYPK